MTTTPKTFPKSPIPLPKPKVVGVAPVPSNTTPATPTPSVSGNDYPKDLGNGDFLLGEVENHLGNHKVQMIERHDPSQYLPLYVKCSCGTEGRFYTIDAMQRFVETHLVRHPR